jgi:hypothetical protein
MAAAGPVSPRRPRSQAAWARSSQAWIGSERFDGRRGHGPGARRQQAHGAQAAAHFRGAVERRGEQVGRGSLADGAEQRRLARATPLGGRLRQRQGLVEGASRLHRGPRGSQREGWIGGRALPGVEEQAPHALLVIGEQQTAVRRHLDVDEREADGLAAIVPRVWPRTGEDLARRAPAGAASLEGKGEEAPARVVAAGGRGFREVVADEVAIAIPRRELPVLVEDSPVRRAAADVVDAGQAVEVVGRVGPDVLPALVASRGPVIETDGPPPGEVDVPLHVAVEAEEFAEVIDAEIRRVAAAGGDALPALAVRAEAEDRAGALEERRRGRFRDVDPLARAGAVAGDEVRVAVVAAQHRVRVVIAARPEARADASLVVQRSRVAGEELHAIAADGVEPVLPDEQALRPARTKAGGDDLARVEEPVAVPILEAAHLRAVPDEEAAIGVHGDVVAPARQLRPGGLVDTEARRQLELLVEEDGGGGQGQRRDGGEQGQHGDFRPGWCCGRW